MQIKVLEVQPEWILISLMVDLLTWLKNKTIVHGQIALTVFISSLKIVSRGFIVYTLCHYCEIAATTVQTSIFHCFPVTPTYSHLGTVSSSAYSRYLPSTYSCEIGILSAMERKGRHNYIGRWRLISNGVLLDSATNRELVLNVQISL